MPRLWYALCSRTWHVMLLTLAVGMLLGLARLAHSEDTSCAAVSSLKAGTCMPYTYQSVEYVLCNGPYSLCTTANCSHSEGQDTATCACQVVPSGLSLTMPVPGHPLTQPSSTARRKSVSGSLH